MAVSITISYILCALDCETKKPPLLGLGIWTTSFMIFENGNNDKVMHSRIL